MTDKEILDDAAEFIENEFGGERLVKLAASLRAMAQRCGEPVASDVRRDKFSIELLPVAVIDRGGYPTWGFVLSHVG